MKITLLTTLLLLTGTLVAQVEEKKRVSYVAKYDFIAVKDTQKGLFDRPHEFLLLHADGESRFHESNRQFNDSMELAYRLAYPQYANPQTQEEAQEAINHFTSNMKGWKKNTTINYVIRKDFLAQKYQNVLSFAWPRQYMEGPLAFQWQIGTEQDTFLGLHCQVAYTDYGGRKYTAWFAPGIPIPDGPYVFGGLPGLIVRISDHRGWFTFQLKEISAAPQERFWKQDYINPKSKLISRKSYVDQSVEYKNNPRMTGVLDASEKEVLEKKEKFKWKHFLLLEIY